MAENSISQESAAAGPGTAAPVRLRGARLLLVEDDPAQRQEYVRILESFGCIVAAARTAEEGIELSFSGGFDAIISDNVLSGMSGLRSIREYSEWTDAPVLLMTSHFSAEFEKDAVLLGAKRAFAKPVRWHAVASEIAGMLPARGDPDRPAGRLSQNGEKKLTPPR